MQINKARRVLLREWGVTGIGAAIYALLYALGSQIDQTGSTRLAVSLVRFGLALPLAFLILTGLFRYVLPKLEIKQDAEKKRPFPTLAVFLAIFISYVPMFLIQYPGSFVYDSMTQVAQIAEEAYDAFHPLLHTLLIRFALSFYDALQSYEKCGVVYSVIQMLLVSAGFTLVCSSISRSVSRRAAYSAVVFFMLYPAHMAFASNCTKDVLFSVACCGFAALCLEEIRLGALDKPRRAQQIVFGVLACLMRNNMIYAFIVWIGLLVFFRRRFGRMLLWSGLIVLISMGTNSMLIHATNARNGSVVEMLSVPIQQLTRARLYAPQAFTKEQAELMDEVFSSKLSQTHPIDYNDYDPTLSDPIKRNISREKDKLRLPEMAALWLNIGGKCPGIYLDAFLNLTLPSLYPYDTYRVSAGYIELGGNAALTSPFGLGPIVRPRRFESIRKWLNEHIYETGMDDVPLLRYVFNLGFIFWLIFLFLLFDCYRGRWLRVGVLLLPLLLYATYLLGPVMQGRYAYPFVCMIPLFVLRPRQDA